MLKRLLSAIYFIVASKTLLLILPPSHLEPYKNGGTRSLSARLWVWGRYGNGAKEFSRRVVQLAVQEKEFRSFNISITAAYSSYQVFPKLWCNVHSFRWGNNIQWFNHLITWGLYLAKTVFLSFMKETSDLQTTVIGCFWKLIIETIQWLQLTGAYSTFQVVLVDVKCFC